MSDILDDEFKKRIMAILDAEEQLELKYPLDAPNTEGHHAFIKGIGIENSFSPTTKDYNLLFETEYEKIYVWTHSKDRNSALISEINLHVKTIPFWKTAGNLIALAQAYYETFESVYFDDRTSYKIMYYFSPNNNVDEIVFLEPSQLELCSLFNGRIIKATDIANMSPLLELLNRDDKCYTAVSLLYSSFQIHHCCLICELSHSPIKKHESHEPKIWEQANFLSKMESSIVQACRCVESVLGEPPNQKNKNGLYKHKQLWKDLLNIDPDDLFEKASCSYLEFYLKLFDKLRNPSAHSYGNIHFDLERKHTIEAQCFAVIILRGYINKHLLNDEIALLKLNFNKDLLARVSENMSTSLTK